MFTCKFTFLLILSSLLVAYAPQPAPDNPEGFPSVLLEQAQRAERGASMPRPSRV